MHKFPIRLLLTFCLFYITNSFCFSQNCNEVSIIGGSQTIELTNLTAPIEIVQVFDADYQLMFRCEGAACGDQQLISDLAAGTYQVNVQFYDANWQLLCEVPTQAVTVLPIETEGNGDCEDLQVTGGEGKMEITGLTAPIEIVQVFDKDYQLVFRCEGSDCGVEQTIENLEAGLYRVNAQFYDANWQLICQTAPIEVNVEEGNNTEGGNCDNLVVNGEEGQIAIAGLTAPIEIVQVFDANYQVVFRCEGGDCGESLIVTDLAAGLYRVNVQFYDTNWQLSCSSETMEVNVTELVNMPTCSDLRVTGGSNSIQIDGLTAPTAYITVSGPNFSFRCNREEDCQGTILLEDLVEGEYRVNVIFYEENGRTFICRANEIKVQVRSDISNPPSCNDVDITTAPGQIILRNLDARAIVKVFTPSYEVVYECVDGDCNYPTHIIDLPPDFYNISIDLRDDNFNSVCLRRNEPITVPGSGCDLPDYPALAALFNENNGQNWFRKWNLGDCNICDWEGVTCNAAGRVIALKLRANNLRGSLTSKINGLTELQKIDFYSNRLAGPLPSELSDLTQLDTLNLLYNFSLSGCFPENLCGTVVLANSRELPFEGDFAQACATGLGFQDVDGDGLCDDEDCNDFDVNFPMYSGTSCDDGNPSTKNDVILSDGCTCQGDDGSIIADCNTIGFVGGGNEIIINNLSAPVVNIYISPVNRFSSPVFRCEDCEGSEIRAPNLQAGTYDVRVSYISLSNFLLCRKDTTITVQSTFCDHPDANAMVAIFDSLGGTGWTEKWTVNDCNPCGWYGVTCNEQGRVTEIDLSFNRLNGNIPPQIGQLSALEKLILKGTSAGGFFGGGTTNIPPEIGNLQQLQVLNLSSSKGYSSLPKEIGQLINLRELNMFRAYFWGGLPEEFGNLINLEKLNLGYTYYEDYGSTPSTFGNLVNLKELNMANSGIDQIPEGVYNLKKLEKLDLSRNGIEGPLSPRIWELTNLVELSLATNKFNGDLADELANLQQLKILNLAQNDFTSLTSKIGDLTQLKSLNLSSNEISDLPISLGDLKNLNFLNVISNGITGAIPAAFSNIGASAESVNLDFRFNQFTGCFPAELALWCGDKYTVNFSRNRLDAGCSFPTFCVIGGPILDEDNDGILATQDCNDNDPNLPALPRTPCDDGNPNTTEDLIQTDQCTCLGIPNENIAPSCDLIQFFGDNGQLEIRGINTGSVHLKIFNGGFGAILFECLYNCEDQIIFPYPYEFYNGRPGLLNVEIQLYNTDETLLCSRRQAVQIYPNASDDRGKAQELTPIQLFPNPARDFLSLQTLGLEGQKGVLQVFNLLGTTVYEETVELSEAPKLIDIQDLENGMYWLSLKLEHRRRISKRFIVESWR